MYQAPKAVRLQRKSTGHIMAEFHLSATISSARKPSSRLHNFLQTKEAQDLNCTSERVGDDLVLSVVLNPSLKPPEMPARLKNFKLALKKLVGDVPIAVDYSGLH